MPYATPDYTAIRDAILRDVQNQIPTASIGADSDWFIRAAAVAAAVEGLYQHQQWVLRQMFPDTADRDYLERHAARLGLAPKNAVSATGSVTFTGTVGANILAGTEVKLLSGVAYTTTAPSVIGVAGTVVASVVASVAGLAGNQLGGSVNLTAAPAGVNSVATISATTGGADIQSDAGLLADVLDRIQYPPAGGNKYDYARWAKSVGGVASAYVYPLRRGAGTVDIIIMATGGFPAAPLITSVQNFIDSVRPLGVDCVVLGPTAVPVNVTAALTLSGTTLAAATAAINTALASYFASIKPGDTIVKNRIAALIQDTAGVVDFALAAPAANVVTTVDSTHAELATIGVVTIS